MPGTIFEDKMSLTEKVNIGVNIGCSLGTAILILLTVLRFMKNREKSKLECDIGKQQLWRVVKV